MQKNNYFRNVNPKKNLDDKDLYPKKKKPKVKENIKRNYYLLLFFLFHIINPFPINTSIQSMVISSFSIQSITITPPHILYRKKM